MPTLTVTLDQTTTPWTLAVSQSQVQVNAYPTTIAWQLNGNASSGTWPTDAQHRAFAWLGTPPPPGTFTNAAINGGDLSATDNGGATGTWSYQLCALLNGQYYYSPITSLRGLPTTPKIKNN